MKNLDNFEVITSLDNANVKFARGLLSRKNRKIHGSFLVEGENLVKEAICSNYNVQKIFVEENCLQKFDNILKKANCKIVVLNNKVLESLCETVSPQGIVAQIENLPQKEFVPNKPFIVLDGLQDPGNVGTIIRSAVATCTPDIVLVNSVDVFNPKVLRSTVGTIFHANFYSMSQEDVVELCKKYDYQLIVTEMFGQNIFDNPKISNNYALVIGNEGNGVGEFLLKNKDLALALPMNKKVESLNAGVSASVMLYILKGKNINKGD